MDLEDLLTHPLSESKIIKIRAAYPVASFAVRTRWIDGNNPFSKYPLSLTRKPEGRQVRSSCPADDSELRVADGARS